MYVYQLHLYSQHVNNVSESLQHFLSFAALPPGDLRVCFMQGDWVVSGVPWIAFCPWQATGSRVWRHSCGKPLFSSPRCCLQYVCVGCVDGSLLCFTHLGEQVNFSSSISYSFLKAIGIADNWSKILNVIIQVALKTSSVLSGHGFLNL